MRGPVPSGFSARDRSAPLSISDCFARFACHALILTPVGLLAGSVAAFVIKFSFYSIETNVYI